MNETLLIIYNLAITPVAFFSVIMILLAAISILSREKRREERLEAYPFVTIQVPSFNDPIAKRCVEHCLAMDYPKDRYEIQIVDDSTHTGTREQLSALAANPLVTYVHREDRAGFKPGALQAALPNARGEIIVIFDADWRPAPDFLRRVVVPFTDPKVAIVQTRQGFYNHEKNLVTRFAAYLLMIYHTMIMPIHNRFNTVFFCGTAGAIRRSALESVGGWNATSITEDSELTIRLILDGWRTVYLSDIETPSEVPETIEAFCKQQMRWCFGNTRVFVDNAKDILTSRRMSIMQKSMVTYTTLGNFVAPAVLVMTVVSLLGWFIGASLEPFSAEDLVTFFVRFGLSIGFFILGAIALVRLKRVREIGSFFASALTMGIVIAVVNTWAFVSALFSKQGSWYCTPKKDNRIA